MANLTWNEIRIRAQKFAEDWAEASYEKGETQTFYNEFFNIFGVPRKKVARFEEPVKQLGGKQGFIDLLWKGVLLVEQKSAGRDLTKAKDQALGYFDGLSEADAPTYILACDFQNFVLLDLDSREEVSFKLCDLKDHVERFGFILGREKRVFRDQDPVNSQASSLMAQLHDALKDSGYRGHDLERFLVRLVFCLFADDTGIFEPRDIFHDFIQERTREDGADLGPRLTELFQILNESPEERQKELDEDLARFPYINGELFAENLRLPAFSSKMRQLLLKACEFNWSGISPAIFGALFQYVSGDVAARRDHGEHYTTENHILRVIEPLFLDELRAKRDSIASLPPSRREKAISEFLKKLAELRFFDPACGCGNFLIVAYREIRDLETSALALRFADSASTAFGVTLGSEVNVGNFYGIEVNEFPARIAEVALWMMDHIMNMQLSYALKTDFRRIPIQEKPHILHADALEVDWRAHLPPGEKVYVFGNPPFIGSKYQSPAQRVQIQRVANLGGSGGTLDYVCAWFIKAAQYLQETKTGRLAFVSTNSITQGEQVGQLWPILFDKFGLEISFAHRTFEWSSDIAGKAHVHVVIVGFAPASQAPKIKRLFTYTDIKGSPLVSEHAALSPYLVDGSSLEDHRIVVHERSEPLADIPPMISGTQPIDDGNYIFSDEEMEIFCSREPLAKEWMHPYLGSLELIRGSRRWLLHLKGVEPDQLRKAPSVLERMQRVREYRLKSKRKSTLAIANDPIQLNVECFPESSYIAVPEVSSERRDYIPICFLAPPVIPSNKLKIVLGASVYLFAILSSRMHMAWVKTISGRLKSDFQYSTGVVYNTFPWPEATPEQQAKIESLAQNILDARAAHPSSTLADLYDPLTMPPDLRRAHEKLDEAVEKLYHAAKFESDLDRLAHLLSRYEKLTSHLLAGTGKAKKTIRKKRSP